jgi:hypothetical protein
MGGLQSSDAIPYEHVGNFAVGFVSLSVGAQTSPVPHVCCMSIVEGVAEAR